MCYNVLIHTLHFKHGPVARFLCVLLRIAGGLLMISLLVAVVMSLHALWGRLVYEWHGPMNADAPIYWAVGRGILNGLVPYKDLFETKPPGIFLLSGFSLWLGGNMNIGAIAETLTFASLPIAVLIGAMRTHGRRHVSLECGIAFCALVFGVIVTLYTADRSGEYQVESFGALFITLYAAFLAKHHERWSMRDTLVASALLFCGVGMKEPFVLAALAASLLLAERPRDILFSFVIPSFIVGIVGVATLWATGWLSPYLHIYLPEMLGKHIEQGPPLWSRGFMFDGTYEDLRAYLPYLAWLLIALAGLTSLRLYGKKKMPQALFVVACVAASIYLLLFAIGLGGSFWTHHFAFAIPGYAALFFIFVRMLRTHWHRLPSRLAFAAFSVMALSASWYVPMPDYTAMLSGADGAKEDMKQSAAYIDAVLDACKIDRYLFLGVNGPQPYAFTRHSPIGPIFEQMNEWLAPDRPAFRHDMLEQVDASRFVVQDSMNLNWLNVPIDAYLNRYFTQQPWPCAANIPANARYKYLFRFATPTVPLAVTARDVTF